MCAPTSVDPSKTSSASATRVPSSPRNSNALVVKTVTGALRFFFGFLDFALSVPSLFSGKTTESHAPGNDVKTVVIVGGNFAGLAALRELQKWQKKQKGKGHIRIVLIDKREYSEYTPGILRLFCEPDHFFHLAQEIPKAIDGCSLERIQGTVTSILKDGAAEDLASERKILTYVPALDQLSSDNSTQTPATKSLSYDYLILATGATYAEPISPATAVAGKPTTSMLGRYDEWKRAHYQLQASKSVLILGAGATGVELAAEILDHDDDNIRRTEVTIVDAESSLVPLFPEAVGAYAKKWLEERGAKLRLGESLKSWNDRSCTLRDGTVLQADTVYVCSGSRPNSEMADLSQQMKAKGGASGNYSDRLFSLTKRRNLVVKDTLQLCIDGDDKHDPNAPWFACGDVASPPSNDEKQALQAEMQGELAAWNAIKLLESNSPKTRLLRYPFDLGADRIPLVFVLSLGKYDGVLGFDNLTIPGAFAAIIKWLIEYTKVSQMRGDLLGNGFWKIGDTSVIFLARMFCKPVSSPRSLQIVQKEKLKVS